MLVPLLAPHRLQYSDRLWQYGTQYNYASTNSIQYSTEIGYAGTKSIQYRERLGWYKQHTVQG
eukprot:3941921-Rhodomonas_salina.5